MDEATPESVEKAFNDRIQVPVEIHKIETMVDGGNKISLYTPELKAHEQTVLFSFAHQQVFMALATTTIDKLDVPEVMPDIEGGKTDSELLRNVIYRYWEKLGKPMASFAVFYKSQMEKLRDAYKAKLD